MDIENFGHFKNICYSVTHDLNLHATMGFALIWTSDVMNRLNVVIKVMSETAKMWRWI